MRFKSTPQLKCHSEDFKDEGDDEVKIIASIIEDTSSLEEGNFDNKPGSPVSSQRSKLSYPDLSSL